EWPALFAAETLQRADLSVRQEFFDFGDFQLATGHDFPQTKIAFLALKLLVVLMNFAAAFWASNFQRAEVARNSVALVPLGLADDRAGHLGNLFHEVNAFHLAA